MTRDMSSWPESLREALEPGVAPTLDRLGERAREVFRREVSKNTSWPGEEQNFVVQDLRDAAIEVLQHTPDDEVFLAFRELWGLNEYAMPFPASFDTVFGSIPGGAFPPRDMMIDLLYSAIETRARLDEAVEQEQIERREMMRLSRRGPNPEVDQIVDALTGNAGDSQEPMTFDEIVAWMQGIEDMPE